ncbi:TonB-dependent receptor [Sphingomonas sp. RIT328]|uniref:TonB-dependent receptor n=1 Tax=Sphingomonas sp. RIT328 TaxID=1470591 RepID=UPI00044F78DA|nr:TonB-dependent receptor [Sphingomonas sp. RIT328]EZP52579.1 TonB-dependent receptor precursor [Sphingomonas sp. RIT328]
MRSVRARLLSQFAIGVSTVAFILPAAAAAQDASATMGQPGPAQTDPAPAASGDVGQGDGDIVVTGIRASLRESIDLKRNAQGIVDAISAEDMGKFPDTNLAESLQRITGVSIDRNASGEGQFVTVRGFGPEYNLVTLNGRQMPTSTIGDGNSAPASRSFDFANLASEGVASLEVYKSGRATVPSGGIGSVINIRTPRPFDKTGLRGSISARGVVDTSQNGHKDITPEVSGIFSDTFADDRIGILVTGAYQRRNFSANSANIGWRDGYLGNENNWGSLAQPGDPRYANITNRPTATDVYQVPQNGGYDVVNGRRERINGQAVLQFRPIDSLTATIDYTYSRNTIDVRDNSVGIWYNHNDTLSAWTDGPVAGPSFYTERFTAAEAKDLAYSVSQTATRSENKSLGGNLTWQAPGGVTMTLDAHHSTAVSKPDSPYGNSNSFGTAIFGIQNQTLNFDKDLPVISYNMYPGVDALNAANIVPTGNAFRNSYFRDEINQVMIRGHYDHNQGFMDSLDWGFEYTDNKVRSAYSVLQNDTWGGAGGSTPAQRAAAAALLPDNIFTLTSIPDKFSGISGSNDPNIIQSFFTFDLPTALALTDKAYGTCGGNLQCLLPYTTDSRIREKTVAPYFQFNGKFDLLAGTGHFIAGIRYENTDVSASALVPTPTGGQQNSQNEFNVIYSGSGFTTFKGSYNNWLPSVDVDIAPLRNVKLRASYSHTITRADYGSLQGGRNIDQLFRVGGGTGRVGNPNLIPYKSKNIDLSAEWYYGKEDYISVGYFHKDVANYIGSTQINTIIPGVTAPTTTLNGVTTNGPRYQAAINAPGYDGTFAFIQNYYAANFPQYVGKNGALLASPGDPSVNFIITTPFNSSQTAAVNGFEFAIQHNFWNTGFGTILNYTIVNGNRDYNNLLPSSIPQFAITGLSDSANAVLFFDKYGINARAAYNWRKGYLSGSGTNPYYVNTYGQLDGSASYAITPMVAVFVEGINILGENRSGHLRSDRNVNFVNKQDARYSAGVRFTF